MCTLQPKAGADSVGRVMLFSLTCTKRHPLGKSKRAPKVDAFYRATAVAVISTGSSVPMCVVGGAYPMSYFTANEQSAGGDAAGSLNSVNWDTHRVNTLASGFAGVFGLARFDQDFVVSESGAHKLWRVTKAGAKTWLAGSGISGIADGVATESDLNAPLGVAVSGRTVFFVQSDGRLRLLSFTRQLCKFMSATREFAQLFGIIDPRSRNSQGVRDSLRRLDFEQAVDTMQEILKDRTQWYRSACAALGLPPDARGLKGPEGVPAFTTFLAVERGIDDLLHVHNSLARAGLTEHAKALRTRWVNTMNIEHRFGLLAQGHDHMHSQELFVPLLDRTLEEHVASMCTNEFAHCTNTNP